MMSGNLRARLSTRRVFLLSGFTDIERKDLAKKIHQLGDIYFDTESFKSNCTHVICGKLSRSEKFLGACATGKWVLHPTYIYQSAKKGEWLKEEDYEWNMIDRENRDTDIMAEAPRRWRFHVEVFQKNAFGGWKVAVVVSGTKKNTVYKRLLTNGGAEVYNLKLPITKPEKIVGAIAYIFVNEKSAAHVYHLMEYGVLCLKPEFIGDYLIKDPVPDPLEYLINPPGMLSPGQSIHNTSLELSQYTIDSSQMDTSVHSTPEVHASAFLTPASESHRCETVKAGRSETSLQKTVDCGDSNGEKENKASDMQNTDIPKTSNKGSAPNMSAKRKLLDDVENAFKEMKKQKISTDRFVWRPTVLTLKSNLLPEELMKKETPMLLSSSMTGVIHTCLDEEGSSPEILLSALDLTMSSVTSRKYPQPATVHLIMTKVLQVSLSNLLSQKAYIVLMRILHVHPPVTSALISMYLQSLLGPVQNGLSDVDSANKQKWDFVKNVIKGAFDQTENSDDNSEQKQDNNVLLLKYLVALLEQNFQFHIQKLRMGQSNVHKLRSTMLGQLLWPSISQVCLNGRCHDLLSLFEDCLTFEMDVQRKVEIVRLVLSLICMSVELCSCVEIASIGTTGLKILQEDKVSAFLSQIAKKINGCKLDCTMLKQVMGMLQPSWVCLGVCCCLLNELDDYLILEGLPSGSLSLSAIVSKYFFLLPKFSSKPSRSAVCYSPHKKRNTTKQLRMGEINNNQSENGIKKLAEKRLTNSINKRNVKGETPLHTACIKNNVIQLKQLLKTPGVDINARDNAGWTPLHEACNHGNLLCVRELLNFVPAKTVDQYFSKENEKRCRKVDLLVSTDDGITPLHDAVINDRLDVCQLLLQHGGSTLLHNKTTLNFTPVELANTDAMKSLLLSYECDNGYKMSSQESESQSSQEGQGPSEFRYEQVLGMDDSQQFTDREECSKYIHITTQLVKSYIETTNLTTVQKLMRSCQKKFSLKSELMNRQSSSSASSINECCQSLQTEISDQPGSSDEECYGTMSLSNDKHDHVRKDLKLLRKWSKHVKKFENHLTKISLPEDHVIIKSELMFLHSMAG